MLSSRLFSLFWKPFITGSCKNYSLIHSREMSNVEHKVVIVGGGPAGLTAGIYTGRANLSPLILAGEVDDKQIPGGQLMITSEVENFPGFPDGIDGHELVENMQKQAQKFGATIVEKWATEFKLNPGGPFKVKVGEEWIETDAVILANGATSRWLCAPNEEKYRNHGISGCATCDGPLPIFRNKHIFVVGGGDSAIEEAIFLTKFASKVSILHRRDQLRASKIMQERVAQNPKININYNTEIVGYNGENNLESIIVKNTVTAKQEEWPAGGLFMAIGHDPMTRHLKNSNVELDEKGFIKVRDNVYTNIEGVFAAGDVQDTIYRQAITAAGFGCMAAIAAERWLEQKEMNKK